MKTYLQNTRCLAALIVIAFGATASTRTVVAEEVMMKHADTMKSKIGLSGYCSVCVVEHRKWAKGDPTIKSTFDGVDYLFPSQAIKAKFDANPQAYVPALNGDCIVCYEKMGKRVPGSVQHAAIHNNRVYLFPSDREKQAFVADAAAFEDSDLVIDGECIVCLAKAKKHVPGLAAHTVIHDGLRYQFPSSGEASVFRASPQQFIHQVSAMSPGSMMKKVGMKKAMSDNGVRLVGRSGCAACEFGVTPISAPDELGLAVVGSDGRITVVEGAHENYPQIYRDRFQEKQLVVEGRIVKTHGKISWLQPTSLQVVN